MIEKNEFISDLEELTDGTKLCLLIEMLTKEPLPKKPKMNATHPLHKQVRKEKEKKVTFFFYIKIE